MEPRLREALVIPRHAFVPRPDTEVIDTPARMQIVTPSRPEGGLNEVSLFRADEANVEAEIDAALAKFSGRFRWVVGPDSTPADLSERLARRGLIETTMCVMVRATDSARVVDDDDIEVAPVTTATELEAFTQVMAQGFGGDARRLRELHRGMHGATPRRAAMFVARWRGRDVAAAASFLFDDSVYLQGGVVLPEARGRGLYRALVAARLAHAHTHGRPLATTHAHHRTSAPILERLGFETLARLPCYGPG